jgi:CRISPR-associated protein Csh1
MSLAYKLWRIGSVLDKEDIFELMNENDKIPPETQYLIIDFVIENNTVTDIQTNQKAVSRERLFLTPKIGGSGTGIYYLYPNISLQKTVPSKKIFLLKNTLEKTVSSFADAENKRIVSIVLNAFDTLEASCAKFEKGDYVFCVTINGQTLWECMPEVWEKWVKCPFVENDSLCEGRDIFSNESCMVGYQPDIKVFSYDNYHPSFKHRLTKNYAFSAESARNIRFGWMFVWVNLFFWYKGQAYCLIPNLIHFAVDTYKEILMKYVEINKNERYRNATINDLKKQEDSIQKQLVREQNSKKKNILKIEQLEKELKKKGKSLLMLDAGFIAKSNEELENFPEYRSMMTIDYYFFDRNLTNKSFQIKGALEEILPSRISQIVDTLRKHRIDENITYSPQERSGFVSLKHFFSRKEIELIYTKGFGAKEDFANTILKERLYLARLLLTNEQIALDNLLARFEYHREKDYEGKKRVRDGVKDWITYSGKYREAEDRVIIFLTSLNKIKE